MSNPTKTTVLLDLKRLFFYYYTFETTDTVADGDHLFWAEAGVVFRIEQHPFYPDGPLVVLADPDPLCSDILSLELERL